jgi:hypothetical protein
MYAGLPEPGMGQSGKEQAFQNTKYHTLQQPADR